jgi:hypothetical protein
VSERAQVSSLKASYGEVVTFLDVPSTFVQQQKGEIIAVIQVYELFDFELGPCRAIAPKPGLLLIPVQNIVCPIGVFPIDGLFWIVRRTLFTPDPSLDASAPLSNDAMDEDE